MNIELYDRNTGEKLDIDFSKINRIWEFEDDHGTYCEFTWGDSFKEYCVNGSLDVLVEYIFNLGRKFEKSKQPIEAQSDLPKGWFEVVRDKHGKNGVLKRAIKADEVICFSEYDDKTVDVVLKDHISETTEPYEVLIQKYKKALAEGSE